MPASSRKRNKGKDRKAKKAAVEAKAAESIEAARVKLHNMWRGWFRGDMVGAEDGNIIMDIQCKHGVEVVLPDKSHPISSFMDTFFLCDTLKDTILNHQDVWKNDNNRKLAVVILTSIGANMMCMCMAAHSHNIEFLKLVIKIAHGITMLENYNEALGYDSTANPIVGKRSRDLQIGSVSVRRDLLKFYRKRMKCKCLKETHLEARKNILKMGACLNCNQVKERSLLMVCSRCMAAPYCSRKCQVEASPKHRMWCDRYVKFHQQQTMANDSS